MTLFKILVLVLIVVIAVESQSFEREPSSLLAEQGLHRRQVRSPRLYIPNRFRGIRRRRRKPIRLVTSIVMIGADDDESVESDQPDNSLIDTITRRTFRYYYYH